MHPQIRHFPAYTLLLRCPLSPFISPPLCCLGEISGSLEFSLLKCMDNKSIENSYDFDL